VVDDGSTDGSRKRVTAFRERVRVIPQANQGVAAARNRGALAASAPYLAFLDADDLWLPTKLERQLHCFEGDPRLGLVHCGVEEIEEDGRPGACRLDGRDGDVWREMLLFEPAILGGGSAVLIPRLIFQQSGGFDQRLSTSADWDLYFRIAARHPVGFVPEVLVRYRFHGGNMHANLAAMEHDMLLAYEKAFAEGGPRLQPLRRQAYGRLHTVLAGSFFSQHQLGGFLRHAFRALALNPANAGRFLGYPGRQWRRPR
jgi:glycosyltransferase involved in cell wall biosynthesis